MAGKKETCEIVQRDNPVLRGKAKPVPPKEIGSQKLNLIIRQMNEALEQEEDGVALAAPQIGVPLRLFVVSARAFTIVEEQKGKKKGETPVVPKIPMKNLVAINPEIIKLSKKKVKTPEGCLSVRWLYGNTRRHEKAMIKALDEHGKPYTYGGSGLIAQIFQHETDHLNGILFTDHATDLETIPPEQIAEMKKHKNPS